ILGGTSSVSEAVEEAIKALAPGKITTERVKGKNRELTAIEVYRKGVEAKAFPEEGGTVIIATGYAYADALSISSYAYASKTPILLTEKDGTLRTQTRETIENGKFARALILGGNGAVTEETEAYLKSLGITTLRLAGKTRYETNAEIVRWELGLMEDAAFQPETEMTNVGMGVARGDDFADAVASVDLLGTTHSVLLLVHNKSHRQTIEASIEEFIVPYVKTMKKGYIFGGTGAVSEEIEEMLNAAIK
ncbi:MAG: cell wall-binding repeat-containing protein, partial [Lachnospiraceae bacterium]|nr:cell wall-binding repeat-containing protein [Lachnospiraceae bacterium]